MAPVTPLASASAPSSRIRPSGGSWPAAGFVALAPIIAATKSDSFPDPNADGKAEPGDAITYDVNISNTGASDATGVTFTDTIDPNTTLVPGSLRVSPLAFADTYSTTTNVALSVPAPGVLINDTGMPSPAAQAIAGGPTAQGGTVTLNADGSFGYTPPSGFEGADTFTYTATNGLSPDDTATVTINVDSGPTVTSTSPANGATGVAQNSNITVNFSEPVNATAASFSVQCPVGSPQTFTLSASPAASFTLDPSADLPAGTTCAVTVTASQITDADVYDPPDQMAADYTFSFGVKPVAVDDMRSATGNVRINTAATGYSVLANDQAPGATVTAFDATSAHGGNVTMNTSTGTFTYDPPRGFTGTDSFNYTISSGTGSDQGTVVLTVSDMIWFINNAPAACSSGCDGRLTHPFTSLAAFEAVNGNGAVSGGTVIDPEAGDNVFIYSGSGNYVGPVTLENDQRVIGQGASASLQTLTGVTPAPDSDALPSTGGAAPNITSAGNGFNVASNDELYGLALSTDGASVTGSANVGALVVGDVAINNAGRPGAGIVLDDGGSVTTTGTNTIATGAATALNVTNTTIGAGGLTFQSISSTGGTVSSVILNNTGSGAFTVTGTGATAASGGTIKDIAGADAVRVNSTGGLVTLKNMVIQNITATGDSSAANNTRSNVDAIHGQDVLGGLSLDNVQIRRISDDAVNGSVDGPSPTATVWNGLTITNCLIEDTNRFHVSGRADAGNEAAVRVVGVKGTVSVTGSTFQRAAGGLDFNTATSGSLNLTVQSSTFSTLYKEPGGTASVGHYGINLVQLGTLNSVVRIGDPAETDASLGNTFTNGGLFASVRLVTQAGSSGAVQASVARNSFAVTDHSSPGEPAGSFSYNFPQGGVLYRALGTGNFEGVFASNTLNQVMHADGGLGQLSLISERGAAEFIVRNNTFQLPWDAPVELRADGASGQQTGAQVLFEGNTYVDGTIGDGTTDVGGQSPFTPFYVQVRGGGKLDLTFRNENPFGLHDSTFSGFANSFHAQTTNSGDVLNLFLQNCESPLGYQLRAATGSTYNLYRNGSAAATAQGVLQANGNTGGGGSDTTTPPTVSLSGPGTVALSNTPPALPSVMVSYLSPFVTGQREHVAGHRAGGNTSAREWSDMSDEAITAEAAGASDAGRISPAYPGVRFVRASYERPVAARVSRKTAAVGDALTRPTAVAPDERVVSAARAGATSAALLSGETVNASIGTLPAGKTVHISFQVTVNNPFTGAPPEVSNQGTVSGGNFASVLTDDPSVGGSNDPTVTPILTPPDVTIKDASAAEPATGTAPAAFAVTLSHAYSHTVTVDFATADDTGGANPAASGSDYTATSGTLTFNPGETVQTISVPVLSDADALETNETFLVDLSGATGGGIVTDAQAVGTITPESTPGTVVISELRTSGPAGPDDDFVELYNNTDAPIAVAASDASGGWALVKSGTGCSATLVVVAFIPNGTVIPARGNYLVVGSAYSLGAYAAGDQTLVFNIEDDRNVALFNTAELSNVSTGARLDAVGFGSNAGGNCDLLREGATLQPAAGSTSEYSFVRKVDKGETQDTNDNAADSVVVSTTPATAVGANASPKLGAPGPENSTGARGPVPCGVTSSAKFGRERLDSTVALGSAPNTVREATAGPNAANGTIDFRRRFTNNTGGAVTRLRFRITNVKDASTPGAADLRALTSAPVAGVTVNDPATCGGSAPCSVTVVGTTLEQPPAQGSGGSINSSLGVGTITLGTPLASGASVNLHLLFGVQQTGDYHVSVVVETATAGSIGQDVWELRGNTETGGHSEGGCNTPPVADAGADQTLECAGGAASVTLDGAASTDADGDTLTYEWREGATVLGTAAVLNTSLPFGPHTITLKVTDPSGDFGEDTVGVDVVDTADPTITAPPNVSVNTGPGATSCGAFVSDATLGSANASDGCSASVTITRTGVPAGNNFPVGTTMITYTADDGHGHTREAYQFVTVTDNTPPTVNAPADIEANAPANSCSVSLDPGAATAGDNCPGVAVEGVRSDNQPLGAPYPVGTTTITWTATDAHNNTATAAQTVKVNDVTAPAITLTTGTINLAPPNHQYQTFSITDLVASAGDGCDAGVDINDVVISQATSDEPENANGNGDGNTLNDIVVAPDCKSLQLRRERDGGGDGRVYAITLQVKDSSGNVATAVRKVFVPRLGPAAEGPPQYAVNGCLP